MPVERRNVGWACDRGTRLNSRPSGAFRCAIAPEHSAAQLRIGRRKFQVNVLDTSRDSFTIRCSTRIASKIQRGSVVRLEFRGEKWTIERESLYNESAEFAHVGCRRVQDITPIRAPRSSLFPSLLPRFSTTNDPALMMYLLIAFMVACVSLPGLGDSIGTAPRIRDGLKAIMKSVSDTF